MFLTLKTEILLEINRPWLPAAMTNRICDDQKTILSDRRRPREESYSKFQKDGEINREWPPANIEASSKCSVDTCFHASVLARLPSRDIIQNSSVLSDARVRTRSWKINQKHGDSPPPKNSESSAAIENEDPRWITYLTNVSPASHVLWDATFEVPIPKENDLPAKSSNTVNVRILSGRPG